MNQKTTYLLLPIAILSLSFIVSCKHEKATISSDQIEEKYTEIHVDNKKANSSEIIIGDSIELKYNDPNGVMDSVKNETITSSAEDTTINKNEITQDQKKKNTPEKKVIKKKKEIKKKRPQIEFDELVWDFGEIIEGDIIENKFKFSNTGNAPLEIIATSATCGCTRPSFPFLEIAPGESNFIGVTYNSVGKEGEQNPEVSIESNTEPNITVIKLQGVVNPKVKKKEMLKLVKDSLKNKK